MNATEARTLLESGRIVTVKYDGTVSVEAIASMGLDGQTGRNGKEAGWLWASMRLMGPALYMLTMSQGGKATWVNMAGVSGQYVTWGGWQTEPNLTQSARERMVVAGLRAMGYLVASHYTDKTDRLCYLGEIRCALCGGKLTGARSIESGMGPECRGDNARRADKRREKEANAASFEARMRERMDYLNRTYRA